MTTQDLSMRVERSAKTLRELTLDKMRDAIVSLRFRPGERLVERDLCDLLGVSRTVVREVLRHLEAEGFVQTQGHRGPVVARATPEEARQIYDIRSMLEGAAARACAEAHDDAIAARLEAALAGIRAAYDGKSPVAVIAATTEFYEALFAGAGMTVAWAIVSSLNARINHLRALTIATPGRDAAGPAQMAKIVAAIRRGDGEAAALACREHVARASALAQDLLAEAAPPVALATTRRGGA